MSHRNKRIAIIALFSAISAVLMYFDFPLPIAPTFMKMDLSELPVIIGGFALSPITCVIIAILKVLIKIAFKFTSTMFLGEIANLLGSIAYALPASIIYAKMKTKKRAVIGLVVGIVLSSIVCTLCNALFLFPLYMNVFHMTEDKIIAMCSAIFPFINDMNKVYLFSVLPFNIVKFSIVSIITYFFYKNISRSIKAFI